MNTKDITEIELTAGGVYPDDEGTRVTTYILGPGFLNPSDESETTQHAAWHYHWSAFPQILFEPFQDGDTGVTKTVEVELRELPSETDYHYEQSITGSLTDNGGDYSFDAEITTPVFDTNGPANVNKVEISGDSQSVFVILDPRRKVLFHAVEN